MRCAYALAALLVTLQGALGCELIVGDDSRHVEDDGGATDDADSAVAVDAGCGAQCATTESSCTSGCTATEATCNMACMNTACQHQCQMSELQCAMACQSACTSCAAPDHCAMPGPCGAMFP